MPIHIKGSGGEVTKEYNTAYDLVIDTQEKFNALVASSNWLGVHSVMFVGDGGTSKFTKSGTGILIPQTVFNIAGMKNAIIEVTNFVYNSVSNIAALYYNALSEDIRYSINDLSVICVSTANTGVAIANCSNLTNCIGTGNLGKGIFNCRQLIDCVGAGTQGNGISNCTGLINCTGNNTSGNGFSGCSFLSGCTGFSNSGTGMYNCKNIVNCVGKSLYGAAFNTCDSLANCSGSGTTFGFTGCTLLSNCKGSGTSGYGFNNCNYLNGCSELTSSSLGFLGGTNLKVDTATVTAS